MSHSGQTDIDSLYGALVEAAVDGIITIDEHGLIQSFNHAAEHLFGYAREEVLGQSVNILMPKHYAEHHDEYLENYLKGFKAKIIGIGRDVPGQRKDGTVFPMHLSVGEAQTVTGRMFIGVCHDLTGQKKLLLQLARAERRFKDIVQSQKEMICRLDEELRLSFINDSGIAGLGRSESDLIGRQFVDLVNEDQRAFVMRSLRALLDNDDTTSEVNLVLPMRREQEEVSVDWRFKTVVANEDFGTEIQGYGLDVTERERALREAKFLLNHDQLTGLLNRQAMLYQFQKRSTEHTSWAVLYFDCNHFGLINQKFGHDMGDQLLLGSAQRLQQALPDDALVARPGGDDFIVVCPVAHPNQTVTLARSLLDTLEEPYHLSDTHVEVRGRVGVAHYPEDADDLDVVISMAESALFYRDRLTQGIGFYHAQQQASMLRLVDLDQRLRLALQQRRLDVYLQPKYQLDDQRLVGYEALLRWQEDGQFVSPAEFVPVAERMGLGIALDRYVLDRVSDALIQAREMHFKPAPIAINITAKHFSQPGFCDHFSATLARAGLDASAMELEITEGILIDREDLTLENLQRIRALGVRLNIDDFGTGYSSLSYLADLPVDVLKIDKAFIDRLDSAKGRHLVQGIIAMAQAMNLQIVAEGIETSEQLALLRGMGCHIGQGYLLGRPAPITEVLQQAATNSAR